MPTGDASARAVSARSCAEIPVDVPVQSIKITCGEEGIRYAIRTVLVVDRNGIRRPVSLLVLRDHHRDRQRLEVVARERDAYVSAAAVTG
jgi:hypothetical protein